MRRRIRRKALLCRCAGRWSRPLWLRLRNGRPWSGLARGLMSDVLSGIIFGTIAVLTLDTFGSLLSQRLKFPYTRLSPISLLLWATAGAIASRGAASGLVRALGLGWIAGCAVGLLDSTVGWWISWQLGPGRLRPELITGHRIARIIFRVTTLAAGIGALGALLFSFGTKLL